jgi:hypothetical protein
MRMKIVQWNVKKENQRGGPWEKRFCSIPDGGNYTQDNSRTCSGIIQHLFNPTGV